MLYVAGAGLDPDLIAERSRSLPKYMRPVRAVRVSALPLDPGVGKVRRSVLPSLPALDDVRLDAAAAQKLRS